MFSALKQKRDSNHPPSKFVYVEVETRIPTSAALHKQALKLGVPYFSMTQLN